MMGEQYDKYVTPLYLVCMVCCILYGFWYRDNMDNAFALMGIYFILIPILVLLYGLAKGMHGKVWIYPLIAAAGGVPVYVLTGHDGITVDLTALYLLLGYFAVAWLGVGARRLFQTAWSDPPAKKRSGKNRK